MFKNLAFLAILALTAAACGDAPEAPIVTLDMSLDVIEAQGTDPMLVRAHIQNVGNTTTVSRGGCWLVQFSVLDAEGNAEVLRNPCVLAAIDCPETVIELLPRQRHEADLRIHGFVYEMHIEEQDGNAYFWCDEVPMVPGEYTALASFAYRTDDMSPEELSLVATASTTFTWSP